MNSTDRETDRQRQTQRDSKHNDWSCSRRPSRIVNHKPSYQCAGSHSR